MRTDPKAVRQVPPALGERPVSEGAGPVRCELPRGRLTAAIEILLDMVSNVEIALIAAGSAIGGSLITGGLAYLGMRHQTKHDRKMRLMEARIKAYADLMAVAFDTVNQLSLARAPWRSEPLRQQTVLLLARATAAIGEVRLLATRPVVEASTELMDAVQEGADFALSILKRASERPPLARLIQPDPVPAASAPGKDEVMGTLSEAGTKFVEAAKAELGFR